MFISKIKRKNRFRIHPNGGFRSLLDIAKDMFPIKSDSLEYRKSKIAGIGVFTKNSISKSEKIIEYKGEIIENEEQMVKKIRKYKPVMFIKSNYFHRLQYGGSYVDATESGNAGRFINHSCDPNCVIYQTGHKKKIFIFAKKKYSSKH